MKTTKLTKIQKVERALVKALNKAKKDGKIFIRGTFGSWNKNSVCLISSMYDSDINNSIIASKKLNISQPCLWNLIDGWDDWHNTKLRSKYFKLGQKLATKYKPKHYIEAFNV